MEVSVINLRMVSARFKKNYEEDHKSLLFHLNVLHNAVCRCDVNWVIEQVYKNMETFCLTNFTEIPVAFCVLSRLWI